LQARRTAINPRRPARAERPLLGARATASRDIAFRPDGAEQIGNAASPALFRQDGSRILAGLAEDRIDILDAATGRTVTYIDQTPAWHSAWTPDSRRLVTSGRSLDTDLWDISRLSDK
jgi:hypothetical protein